VLAKRSKQQAFIRLRLLPLNSSVGPLPITNMKVFVLHHIDGFDSDEEDTKLIGIYSTRHLAEEAIERKRKMPGFKEAPDAFHIDEMEIDKDYWSEGFIKSE
jgi:hypothetical protein